MSFAAFFAIGSTLVPWIKAGFVGSCWLLALGWLFQAITALRGMPKVPDLTQIDPGSLPPLPQIPGPHLTVVVPACNEQENIQSTLRSLLSSTGIRLQIIAVDDRSTDNTAILMDHVAAEAVLGFPRHTLTVVRNRALPPGWLGKPHALHLAAQQALAPWILFTDGDLHFDPRALELALRHAMAVEADHLVLMPTLVRQGTAEAAIQATIQAFATWAVRMWKVDDKRARDFFGVGGFNMVRAAAFTQIGGFETLRMEVLEDLCLGWTIKHRGLRSRVALGPGLVTIRWIEGPLGIVRNIEKNGFAVFRYSPLLAFGACCSFVFHAFAPLAALTMGGWALAAGLLFYAAIALLIRANRTLSGVSPLAAFLFAPAALILCYGFARSTVLTLARGGVTWRGTTYPLSALRQAALKWR